MPTLLCGCNLLTPLAFILPEPKRTVDPEYAHLQGDVAVLVWVEPELLYDYPYLRVELASHVADQIQANVAQVDFADAQEIEEYLQLSPLAVSDPHGIGTHFKTRYVLYVELLDFSLRDPHIPEYLQAKIRASVTVYEMGDTELPPERFELNPVEISVPENRPVRFSQASAAVVRKKAYEVFGGTVAKKFYPHQVVVE